MAGVCAVDLAGVTEFVVFEHLAVVVEMVGKVDVIVIPEGDCNEGTKFLGRLGHAVVFFDDAGLASGGRDQGPFVVTLFGEYAELIVNQKERILVDLRMKASQGFFQQSPRTIVSWTKTKKSHYSYPFSSARRIASSIKERFKSSGFNRQASFQFLVSSFAVAPASATCSRGLSLIAVAFGHQPQR
ncbi:MAG: hypothetical protein E6R05_05955 [Candidatus Moraniibacteriota bacterium]|nr:MAG: hypothetical protein E6R05_05955 [Candidatus Moranbacteria bacterium]